MTSVEVPYAIAAALPTLSVMDITNDVAKAVAEDSRTDGIAYIHAVPAASVVRIQERETGFFEDLEIMLERVVPGDTALRHRIVSTLLGPRTEAVPFKDGCLCLGTWQRVLLFSLDAEHRPEWSVTLLG
jgi:secondary thiamine-phosphate synthase enzyme